jgi:hypothetical protein
MANTLEHSGQCQTTRISFWAKRNTDVTRVDHLRDRHFDTTRLNEVLRGKKKTTHYGSQGMLPLVPCLPTALRDREAHHTDASKLQSLETGPGIG